MPSTVSAPVSVFQRTAEMTESVWISIGRAAETMNDLERAQRAYEHSLSLNPKSWRALTQAAHICRCREDYPRVSPHSLLFSFSFLSITIFSFFFFFFGFVIIRRYHSLS
ncbi:glucose repression mediator protein [Serendipita sp. 401]|nr:glucose repression mediator protein [Serendipita sp. 401]